MVQHKLQVAVVAATTSIVEILLHTKDRLSDGPTHVSLPMINVFDPICSFMPSTTTEIHSIR